MRDLGQQALGLCGVGGDHQFVAAANIGVDALGFGNMDHFIDGAHHGAHHAAHRVSASGSGIALVVPGKAARQPATIAARGPEPGKLLFQHHHRQGRVRLFEIIGRP